MARCSPAALAKRRTSTATHPLREVVLAMANTTTTIITMTKLSRCSHLQHINCAQASPPSAVKCSAACLSTRARCSFGPWLEPDHAKRIFLYSKLMMVSECVCVFVCKCVCCVRVCTTTAPAADNLVQRVHHAVVVLVVVVGALRPQIRAILSSQSRFVCVCVCVEWSFAREV